MNQTICTEIRQKKQGVQHCFSKNMGIDGKYICPYCDEYKTKNCSTMSMHISRKHGIVAGRQVDFFKCASCPKKFNTGSALAHHNKTHEVCTLPCSNCDMKFKTDAALCTHYVRAHMDENSMVKVLIKDGVKDGVKDEGDRQCLCCNKVKKERSMTYHLAKCSPESPFSKAKVVKDAKNQKAKERSVEAKIELVEAKKYAKMVKELMKNEAKAEKAREKAREKAQEKSLKK